MSDGFKRLFRRKHSFTSHVAKNYFESPVDFSVGLELAKESLADGFGFTEVIEHIQS